MHKANCCSLFEVAHTFWLFYQITKRLVKYWKNDQQNRNRKGDNHIIKIMCGLFARLFDVIYFYNILFIFFQCL